MNYAARRGDEAIRSSARGFLVQRIEGGGMMVDMRAFRAHVENGRIIVDGPTDLPDGTELYLLPIREGDELDDEERAALHAAIVEAEEELDAGKSVTEDQLWTRLRTLP
jgi:hypothetical protein